MARFVSVLSGSTPSLTAHDVRSITAGTNKRDGLIASRSAVSADINGELDIVNQNGALGIYFPPDLFTITNGVLTGSAYTASAVTTQGIITPSNYQTRPTASIRSTDTALIGQTNPLDSASVTYNTYLSASTAVRTVLDSITDGGPYARQGLNPSRTLHSIWHDPNLAYFAWDDFTPGTPSTIDANVTSTTYTDQISNSSSVVFLENGVDTLNLSISWAGQYAADTLGTVTASISIRNKSTLVVYDTNTGSVGSGTTRTVAIGAGNFTGNTGEVGVEKQISVNFSDITIPSHLGATATTAYSDLNATGVGPIRPVTLFPVVGARVSQSVDNSFCTNATELGTTLYCESSTLAGANRLYSDKVGNFYSPLAEADYYIVVGTITNGVTDIYRYNNGRRLGQSTATCSDAACIQIISDYIYIASDVNDCDSVTTVPALTYNKGTDTPSPGSTLYSNNTCTTTYTPASGFVKLGINGSIYSISGGTINSSYSNECLDV